MEIFLTRLLDKDARKLFLFEEENRSFFETLVPGRGDEYYNYDTFLTRHNELLEEQIRGESYFYLIKNELGEILGRVNFVDIDAHTAQIGYRVGEQFLGRGIAQKAVKLGLIEARSHGIKTIYAKTTSNNIGSQKVLERNNFRLVNEDQEEIEFLGQTVRFIHFAWHQ
ncbi:N-acetyltransferase [Anaerobacillus alkaliphilus]|uniref:N-acetyltransferase n=1 Tax=Anaerobacillus alkaliphilus TaxID=1548597 RepID=A0A4Q0W0H9_9BACI|nr:GNAT family protein [Anaerobacillus alkaliphilus]RXJ04261.1 N-acetyltransferase [Anaerobacillus alkaliphilus]